MYCTFHLILKTMDKPDSEYVRNVFCSLLIFHIYVYRCIYIISVVSVTPVICKPQNI